MGAYVISDIHGCYREFLMMLERIKFSDRDRLFLAGDYIDRGMQSYEMLKWLEHCPANIYPIRGNHEEEFAAYIDLMIQIDRKEELETDVNSRDETAALYSTVKYLLKKTGAAGSYFDLYGTVGDLINHAGATLKDLCRWAEIIREMPYYRKFTLEERTCIVVHAGYAQGLEDKEFYLYAREESCQFGGVEHGIVIAGHTPTIAKGTFAYNGGKVFRYYNKEKDCIFYDIDCGCVFRSKYPEAKLSCIRLEDEQIFYL
ncbi:MAG: metallophosphoesterase [Roseburia sp.]|nr:metallophosphoesterase [Roseburia sp.]